MTAPVIEFEGVNGKTMNFSYQKFTPRVTLQTKFKNINLVTLKGGPYAVVKYSGRSSYDNFLKYVKILREFLIKDNVKP